VIFVSYSSTDRGYVDQLVAHLKQHGVPVWYDPNIRPGDRYVQAIEQAIDGCTGIVVVMSNASKASTWVESECEAAAHRHKLVLPFLLEGTPFLQYTSTQYVDVRGGKLPDAKVIEDLKQIAAGRQPAPRAVLSAGAPSPAGAVPPRAPGAAPRKRRAGVAVLVTLLALALVGGVGWGVAKLVGAVSAEPTDVDRLASEVSQTYKDTTITITRIWENPDSAPGIYLEMLVNNEGSDKKFVIECCELLEQPAGRQRQAVPGMPSPPIPAGYSVSTSVGFYGWIDAATTNLRIVLAVKYEDEPATTEVEFTSVALTPP
jgi:hypothetical protein